MTQFRLQWCADQSLRFFFCIKKQSSLTSYYPILSKDNLELDKLNFRENSYFIQVWTNIIKI